MGFPRTIWKSLDRLLVTSEWEDLYRVVSIIYIVRLGSDHAPLLITLKVSNINGSLYFLCLNFWGNIIPYLSGKRELTESSCRKSTMGFTPKIEKGMQQIECMVEANFWRYLWRTQIIGETNIRVWKSLGVGLFTRKENRIE